MKFNNIRLLLALFLISAQLILAQKQIIINELSQGPDFDWEWIEYLVTGNNTDIRGVYLDDDDSVHGTIGSVKMVQLKKDLPAFQNVSIGSIIVIYKSTDSTVFNMQDPKLFEAGAPDTDFLDGVLIIPHTNTEFLEPGSWWPQFRAAGDNVGIFDSSGVGIFGISYGDKIPKGDFSNGWGMVNLLAIPYHGVGFYTGTLASTADDSTLWIAGWSTLGTPGSTNLGQGTVPVELSSFSASYSESEIILQWETATELNNYGFEIERSDDNITWQKIGFLNGNGSTTERHSYQFKDSDFIFNNTYYYRLKQIDFNGSSEFSQIIEINPSLVENFILEQNYPNPFNPETTIKFSLSDKENVSLKVFNSLGEEVRTIFSGTLEAGIHTYNFDATDLTSGVYVYVLKGDFNVQVKKMMLIK